MISAEKAQKMYDSKVLQILNDFLITQIKQLYTV